MNKNTIPSTLLLFSIMLCMMWMGTSCANIIPPTGGPRDSLPPVLVTATPKDSALQFKTNKITLNFDEYLKVDNPTENVVVWPNPKVRPEITSKMRVVTNREKDTLEPNTSYTINFVWELKA